MTTQPMANAKTEDFRNAHAALIRAAQAARDVVVKPNTASLVKKTGQATNWVRS